MCSGYILFDHVQRKVGFLSFYLSLGSPLFTLILLYVLQHRSLTANGQKKLPLTHWFSLEMHAYIGAERRAQVRPTCSIFEQQEPGTEPQVIPKAKPNAQYFFKSTTVKASV
jgi:hypothetical protein